jgi:hypothetical protein
VWDLLDQKCGSYIDDLDEAFTIIAKLGIQYETLSRSDQKELLRNVVERVISNVEGEIERVDLLTCEKVSGGEETSENPAKIETGDVFATCLSKVLECDPNPTQNEHSSLSFASDYVKHLEVISFPQRFALEQLLIDET